MVQKIIERVLSGDTTFTCFRLLTNIVEEKNIGGAKMDNTILIIVIVLMTVIVLALIGFLIYQIKAKNHVVTNGGYDYSEEIREIRKGLAQSSLETKAAIQDAFSDASKKLSNQFDEQKDKMIDLKDNLLDKVENKFKDTNEKLGKSLEDFTKKVEDKMQQSNDNNVNHLKTVSESLGKITESQKSLENLNTEVNKLNAVFSNSQLRGRFGEIRLERILEEIFSNVRNMYALQYEIKVKNGAVRPDAVVFLDEKTILCIDSKFSFTEFEKVFDENPRTIEQSKLSSLKSALQNEIKKISHDYIIKNVTYIYAMMFIPSDSIYNFIQLSNYLYSNVIEYARQNKVLIVSPSTIQPILANINFLRINIELSKNIKEVVDEIEVVRKTSESLKVKWDDFTKTFNALKNKKEKLDNPIENIYQKSTNAINVATKKEVVKSDDLKKIVIEDI